MAQDRLAAYNQRRDELKKMTDDQLKTRFWELCNKVVEPMIDLARHHTSPSIERAVLLRMGIDSVTAKGVVERVTEAGLLGKGAGNCVLRVSEKTKADIPAAAKAIAADKNLLAGLFGK